MTPSEIKAMREKHHDWELHKGYCIACWQRIPCDTIKALDELDRVINVADIYGLTVKAMTEISTADVYEKRITKALDAINKINTMRLDEDDFEWLQTAEFTLKGE